MSRFQCSENAIKRNVLFNDRQGYGLQYHTGWAFALLRKVKNKL